MINVVTVVGYLGADPDVRFFESGKNLTEFRIAISETYGEKETTHWIGVKAWGKTGEFAGNYLRKGSRVCVMGSLIEEKWQEKSDGSNRSRIMINAQRLENLTPRPKEGEEPHGDRVPVAAIANPYEEATRPAYGSIPF